MFPALVAEISKDKCIGLAHQEAMDLIWLRNQLARRGRGAQTQLADYLGVSASVMSKMVSGARPLRAREADRIQQWLEENPMPGTASAETFGTLPASVRTTYAPESAMPPADGQLTPLLVWLTAISNDGTHGGWVLNANRVVDESPRSAAYAHALKAFLAEVIDSRNSPVYKLRDLILVNPELQVQPEDDVLCTNDPHQPNGAPALLGCLKRQTASEWVIVQYNNPKEEIRLPKADWPNAWRVVERRHRR